MYFGEREVPGEYRLYFQPRIINRRSRLRAELCLQPGFILGLCKVYSPGLKVEAICSTGTWELHGVRTLNTAVLIVTDVRSAYPLIPWLSRRGREVKEEWTKQGEGAETAPFIMQYSGPASVLSLLATMVCWHSHCRKVVNVVTQWVMADARRLSRLESPDQDLIL
jgi:hypothetical protein